LLGLTVVNIFKPGTGLKIDLAHQAAPALMEHLTVADFLAKFAHGLFVNPVAAMAQGEVLSTVVFAIFLGIALVVLGDKSKNILKLLNEFFDVVMLIVSWIMKIAPFGITALLMKLVATADVQLLANVAKFIAVVVGATLVHGFVVLPLILLFVGQMSPFVFFKGMREALITALSTSSSSATLPVSIRCVEENLKVDKNIAHFVLPMGATINMDGTALYEAVAAIFVANIIGAHLNLIQQFIVFLTAIIASIGAPGIPSAGMVTMIMVLQSVGLPAEAVALLIPIDRPLDTIRTMVNVEGDAVGAVVIHRLIRT